jgi:hypothetical protein
MATPISVQSVQMKVENRELISKYGQDIGFWRFG